MSQKSTDTSKNTAAMQRELNKTKREITLMRKKLAQLQSEQSQDTRPSPPSPPHAFKVDTKYDFPAATWTNETLVILACVVGHLVLGISRVTTFEYIFLDIVGLLMCATSLIIGYNIKRLNRVSFAQDSPSRVKADRLARIAGWIVAVAFIMGSIVIFYQSMTDMFTAQEVSGRVTYLVLYFGFMGMVWYIFFRPTNLDFYSYNASPVKKSNAFKKKLYAKQLLMWKQEVVRMGYTKDDFDVDTGDSDWDSDWDSSDDSGDWDWGGGDSGGGGASSEW